MTSISACSTVSKNPNASRLSMLRVSNKFPVQILLLVVIDTHRKNTVAKKALGQPRKMFKLQKLETFDVFVLQPAISIDNSCPLTTLASSRKAQRLESAAT
jgi:hypothetical protein